MVIISDSTDYTLLPACTVMLLATVLLAGCGHPIFHSDVDTLKKPWTHSNFRNDPNNFQFAIVADRTGGHRTGIFPLAVERLNWLQPEFVMSIGDLIEGSSNRAKLDRQWEEFEQFLAPLEMPFFYVPGNHDTGSVVMTRRWNEKFGVTFYSFVYRDVLFICLNSQDTSPEPSRGLSNEQIEFVAHTLQQHKDVRWTMLFMHQPLWLYEQGNFNTTRSSILQAENHGFSRIQAMLVDRPHTVFAGHLHTYIKGTAQHHNYYVLATTGGSSTLRGAGFGEFDHVVWVTMTHDGPVMANLTLDGILPDDVHTDIEASASTWLSGLPINLSVTENTSVTRHVQTLLTNRSTEGVKATLDWSVDPSGPWQLEPATRSVTVAAHEEAMLDWHVSLDGRSHRPYPVPYGTLQIERSGKQKPLKWDLSLANIFAYIDANRPIVEMQHVTELPIIDGHLNETHWQQDPQFERLVNNSLTRWATATTQAWIVYDDDHLYLTVDCNEPNAGHMRVNATEHDGDVWDDDSIEVFIDGNDDQQTYYQIIINANGVPWDAVYQGQGEDLSWDGPYRAAAQRGTQAWTLELAIPWKSISLNGPPSRGQAMGFNLVRNRAREKTIVDQWSPTGGANHRPRRFGKLVF